MQITDNRGVDFWLDSVGSDSATYGLSCLAFSGSLIVIQGNPTSPLGDNFTRQLTVHDVFLGGAYNADIKSRKSLARIGQALITLVKEKKIDPLVKEEITFDQIPEALARIKDRHVTGKIVAKIVV
jgi:NADPH:quinone reductase-like Zn-dependent oxidoreductase